MIMTMMKKIFNEKNLVFALGAGILGGVSVGLVAQQTQSEGLIQMIKSVQILGKLFLSSLKMVVVPIVLFSVTSGVANLGGGKEVGRKVAKTMAYFLATSFLAVFIGILFTNLIAPGVGKSAQGLRDQLPSDIIGSAQSVQEAVALKAPESFMEFADIQIGRIFMNPFQAMAEMNLIGVVAFSLFLGLMMMACGEKGRPAREVFSSLNEALMKMVQIVIWLAPIGIFALAANLMMALGPQVVKPMAKYFLTALLSLLTHLFVVYPLILIFVCKYNPLKFFSGIKEAMILAVSTASSAATLPVTMRVVEENCGVNKQSANFVLPMGATINMDGTALYEAVAAMFVAQMLGIELGFLQQVLVFFTATLAGIGAAGIPQAGLVTMVIVFDTLGIPLEWMALIIVLDRPLDHIRTMVNVTGDATGAVFLSYSEGELERKS
jgi:Na+/H+-dicarboxylate symporter